MKLHKIKRIVACVMAGTLLGCSLVGCGNGGTNSSGKKVNVGDVEVTYPLKEKVTLTMATLENATISAHADNLMDTPFGKAWQEATGVEIELEVYADSTALNLMYASGELPDIILAPFSGYSGGVDNAIRDQVIQPITDYMAYAPDLQAVLDGNEYWKKCATTADGDVVGFPFIRGSEEILSPAGLIYRQDYLNAVGMDVPDTADEFYAVLKAFKEKLNIEYPFSVSKAWLTGYGLEKGVMTSPFGLVNSSWYQVDGTIHFGAAEAEYKEVLAFLNKLYKEKLLDNNFTTISFENMGANLMNDDSGVALSALQSGLGNYEAAMEDAQVFELVPGKSLVANDGDTPMYGHYDFALNGYYAVITPACKNIEAAVQFLNYGYTEAGSNLFNFGIEGETYTVVEGTPAFTDMILNNQDGWTIQEAMAQYTLSWHAGPFVQSKDVLQINTYDSQKLALERWAAHDAKNCTVPNLSVASEDLSRYTRLMSDIKTYIGEMTIKYIMGEKSLDTFESEYMATLEKLEMGAVIDMMQKSLDTFNNK
jgi:putative aldouronate transport system substrate-binding protein